MLVSPLFGINGILRFDRSVLGGRESFFVSRRALISIYRSLDIRSEGGCPQTSFGALLLSFAWNIYLQYVYTRYE